MTISENIVLIIEKYNISNSQIKPELQRTLFSSHLAWWTVGPPPLTGRISRKAAFCIAQSV